MVPREPLSTSVHVGRPKKLGSDGAQNGGSSSSHIGSCRVDERTIERRRQGGKHLFPWCPVPPPPPRVWVAARKVLSTLRVGLLLQIM